MIDRDADRWKSCVLNYCVPSQNSDVEALTPKVMVFGNGAFLKRLFRRDPEGGATLIRLVLLKKKKKKKTETKRQKSFLRLPCEDTAGRCCLHPRGRNLTEK